MAKAVTQQVTIENNVCRARRRAREADPRALQVEADNEISLG